MAYAYVVFAENYNLPLGTLALRFSSSMQGTAAGGQNGVFSTAEHEVIIRTLVPALDWLPAGMRVESAKAWLFYLSKQKAGSEQLSFRIELQSVDATVRCGPATRQNLIAIELENGIRQLHIGTEDEEAMAYRSTVGDYMPARYAAPLSKYEMEITTITSCGLFTQIPALEMGEQFYFHYIVAENPYFQSVDYPDEPDASTWFAVEQSKKQLEKNWRAKL